MQQIGEILGMKATPHPTMTDSAERCRNSVTITDPRHTSTRLISDKLSVIMSDNPSVVGLPTTPKPVICKYCGKERHTKGIFIFGRILWHPPGPEPCICADGQAEYEQLKAARQAKAEAEKKAEEAALMKRKVEKVIGDSGLGERFLRRTFATFETPTENLRQIAETAQRYARNFERCLPKQSRKIVEPNGILITGDIGTGKTHVVAAIANHLLNQGIAVICMTERNLFSRIQATYVKGRSWGIERESETEIRNVYETVPLLIIDDLGKEKASEWTIATLYAIIDGRYDRAMPTIVTTNYKPQLLIERISPSGGSKTTAEAVVDRLREMCVVLNMTGESWRKKGSMA